MGVGSLKRGSLETVLRGGVCVVGWGLLVAVGRGVCGRVPWDGTLKGAFGWGALGGGALEGTSRLIVLGFFFFFSFTIIDVVEGGIDYEQVISFLLACVFVLCLFLCMFVFFFCLSSFL